MGVRNKPEKIGTRKRAFQNSRHKTKNSRDAAAPPNACAGKRTSRYFAAFAISRTVASFDSKSEFSGKAIFWKPVFSW